MRWTRGEQPQTRAARRQRGLEPRQGGPWLAGAPATLSPKNHRDPRSPQCSPRRPQCEKAVGRWSVVLSSQLDSLDSFRAIHPRPRPPWTDTLNVDTRASPSPTPTVDPRQPIHPPPQSFPPSPPPPTTHLPTHPPLCSSTPRHHHHLVRYLITSHPPSPVRKRRLFAASPKHTANPPTPPTPPTPR